LSEADQEIERIRQKKIAEIIQRKQAVDQRRALDNSGKPLMLTDDTFNSIRKYPLMLVDFWAAWCGPCRMVAPIIEQLAIEYQGTAWFGKLNVDENPVTANMYGIQSIPAMLLFRNGARVDGIVGAVPKATIESKVRAYLEQN